MRPLNRITPLGQSREYDTYGIIMPVETHTRPATCAEVECGAQLRGWKTMVDVGTEIGQKRARYIIDHSGRHWTAEQDGFLVTFSFPPGQTCFAEHRVSLEREELYTISRGDWRSNSSGQPVGVQEWLNRFGENQETLAKVHNNR